MATITENDLDNMFSGAEDTGVDADAELRGVEQRQERVPVRPQSKLGYGIEMAGKTATAALDAGTLGTARHAMGLMDMIRGIGGEGGNLFDNYNKGYERAHEGLKENYEDLPLGLKIGAEIAGAGKGVPRYADDALDYMTRQFAPNWGSRVTNYAATYAAGVPVAATDRYVRGGEDFETALKGGVFDAAIGVGLQASAGDVAAPWLQKAYRKIMGKTPLGEVTEEITESSLGSGMTLEALYNATDEITSNQGILDLTVGNQGRGETARRFYNAIADTVFPNPNARRMNTKSEAANRALYQETVDTVRRYADEANEEATSTMSAILGKGGRSDPRAKSSQQKAAAAVLEDISRTRPKVEGGPTPIGATMVDARAIANDTQAHLEDVFGQNLSDQMGVHGDVWNSFMKSLRGHEITDHARKRQMIESEGVDGPRAAEILPEIPLGSLYNTRKAMADLLTPAGRIDNNPLTATKRKAVVEVLSVIDNVIDDVTSGNAGLARGAFAKEMRIKEAEEMGYKFYTQRSSEVADEHMFTDHYRDTLEDFMKDMDPATKHSFRKGFSAGMVDMMGKRSPLTELGNYLGDLTSGNVLKEKKQGADHLALVFGKGDADAIADMYTNGHQLIEFRTKLADLFEQKGGASASKANRIGADMRPQDVPSESSGGAFVEGLAWMRNKALDKDAAKVEAMQKVLSAKGPELRALLQQGIEEAAPGSGAQIGVRGGLLYDGVESDRQQEENFDLFRDLPQ